MSQILSVNTGLEVHFDFYYEWAKYFFFSDLILHFQKHKFNLQYPFCLPTSQTQLEMDFHLALAKSLLDKNSDRISQVLLVF